MRFFALRLHEADMIKSSPNRLIAGDRLALPGRAQARAEGVSQRPPGGFGPARGFANNQKGGFRCGSSKARRDFLASASLTAAAGVLGGRSPLADESPPETAVIRLFG